MTEIAVYLGIGVVLAFFYRLCQQDRNDINRHVNRNAFVLAFIFAWPIVGFCGGIAGIVFLLTGERLFHFRDGWDR